MNKYKCLNCNEVIETELVMHNRKCPTCGSAHKWRKLNPIRRTKKPYSKNCYLWHKWTTPKAAIQLTHYSKRIGIMTEKEFNQRLETIEKAQKSRTK